MNYRHAYHAGNPADVFKHIVLVALLYHLRRKETGFFILDTHAGTGLYDLTAEEAGKTQEFRQGIEKIYALTPKNELLERYLSLVKSFNEAEDLSAYPGSPALIRACLRAQDEATFCELHPLDAASLKSILRGSGNIAVHHRDAYEAIIALLPPRQRRGLVLIDPPFEDPEELLTLPNRIATAHKRFPNGLWAIWYPIKDRAALWRFEEAMLATQIRKQLIVEFLIRPECDSRTLNGSAMLFINPPYGLESELKTALEEALPYISPAGKVLVRQLAGE